MIVKVKGGFLEVDLVGDGQPTHPIAPGGPPPGIWGPTDPRPGYGLPGGGGGGGDVGIWPSPGHPAHPIAPGGRPRPPGIWGGAGEGFPTPPIHIPAPPTEPPPDGADKPPPDSGGWGFVAEWGQWGYFPGDAAAQPK